MSDVDAANAVVAFKNAWNGVVATSAPVNALAADVEALAADVPLASLDLESYRRVTMAQANAVMALQGLIEQLQRKTAAA